MLVLLLAGVLCAGGCKTEQTGTREEIDDQKNAKLAEGAAVTAVPGPTTDNAAQVIAACGPAVSDQVITVNDKISNGTVRRMIYNNGREVTLDFIPLQKNSATSSSVWRFNVAVVDNQKLLTAANIKVYLPCAAAALAKEF